MIYSPEFEIYRKVYRVKNRNTLGVDLSILSNKSILITGCSGVIGFNLLFEILDFSGYSALPKITCQMRNQLPESMGKILSGHDNVSIVYSDFSEKDWLQEYDQIIHAATYGQPGRYLDEKITTLELNTGLTIELLKRLKDGGNFLYLSSSDVYSGVNHFPTRENELGLSNPWHKRSAYFESKRCGEAICAAYSDAGISAKVARISLGYGPGFKVTDQRVLYEFIFRAMREGSIRLKDAGTASRTYCYIGDLVEQLFNIMLYSKENYYNASGNSRITILELATLIGSILNVPVELPAIIVEDERMINAPQEVWISNEKYNSEFSKNNYVSISEGVRAAVEWARYINNGI